MSLQQKTESLYAHSATVALIRIRKIEEKKIFVEIVQSFKGPGFEFLYFADSTGGTSCSFRPNQRDVPGTEMLVFMKSEKAWLRWGDHVISGNDLPETLREVRRLDDAK